MYNCNVKKDLVVIKMSSDLDFEQRIRLVGLYDIYGGLLTEKQQKCMEMHLFNDLSLSEIADEYDVTRQAIYDLIKRTAHILERYEDRLRLWQRGQANGELLLRAEEMLIDYSADSSQKDKLEKAKSILHELNEKGGF